MTGEQLTAKNKDSKPEIEQKKTNNPIGKYKKRYEQAIHRRENANDKYMKKSTTSFLESSGILK